MIKIVISGQKHFGAETFRTLKKLKQVEIIAVCAPFNVEKPDRLWSQADLYNIPIIKSGTLNAQTIPFETDLIVCAHSHDFIGEKTRIRSRYGAIGYHPSLLPMHRGRDAIIWTIKFGEKVTGGTVYRLNNKMDGGDILSQQYVFVRPGDDAETLWRRDLSPLGIKLITETVERIEKYGFIEGKIQDESLASFEPSWERQPVFKPDLIMLNHIK